MLVEPIITFWSETFVTALCDLLACCGEDTDLRPSAVVCRSAHYGLHDQTSTPTSGGLRALCIF